MGSYAYGFNLILAPMAMTARYGTAAIELNPEYVVTRYPDAANGVPAQMYTEKMAKFHLEKAEMVINWVKSQMKSENS